MAKSAILKQLANNEISLEVALSRLLVIALEIQDDSLSEWAESELKGYSNADDLPAYRVTHAGKIIYSGINGSFQVRNAPLPLSFIKTDIREKISNNHFFESVSVLESYAKSDSINRDLTFLSGHVSDNSDGEIKCSSIYMLFPPTVFLVMLSEIRTRLIKIFIRLDQSFGCLDNMDIQTEGKDINTIKKEINVIINNDESVKIGDRNKIDGSVFNSEEN